MVKEFWKLSAPTPLTFEAKRHPCRYMEMRRKPENVD
jgi:hypothetical protein